MISALLIGIVKIGKKKQLLKISIGSFFISFGCILFIFPHFLKESHSSKYNKNLIQTSLCSSNNISISKIQQSSIFNLIIFSISYGFIGK